jgi:hypothetical protein
MGRECTQNERDIRRFLYNQQQLTPKRRLFSAPLNLLVSVIFNCRGGFAFLPIVFFPCLVPRELLQCYFLFHSLKHSIALVVVLMDAINSKLKTQQKRGIIIVIILRGKP